MESNIYVLDIRWKLFTSVKILGICACLAFVFYNSWIGILFIIPFIPTFWMQEKKNYIGGRKKQIKENFKDFLLLLSGNLGAGYSLENSFCQSYEEYKTSAPNSLIICELDNIVKGLKLNKRLEEMILELGIKTEVKDIEEFAELIMTAKIYGGNIIKLIKQTSNNYRENCVTEMEITTMIASKKMEAKVMLMAPVMIVVFMRITNGGYMDVLYDTSFGSVIMTICMSLLIIAFIVTNKIIEIEV